MVSFAVGRCVGLRTCKLAGRPSGNLVGSESGTDERATGRAKAFGPEHEAGGSRRRSSQEQVRRRCAGWKGPEEIGAATQQRLLGAIPRLRWVTRPRPQRLSQGA